MDYHWRSGSSKTLCSYQICWPFTYPHYLMVSFSRCLYPFLLSNNWTVVIIYCNRPFLICSTNFECRPISLKRLICSLASRRTLSFVFLCVQHIFTIYSPSISALFAWHLAYDREVFRRVIKRTKFRQGHVTEWINV